MGILTIDLETSTKNTEVGSNKASPFYPGNNIVATGVLNQDQAITEYHYDDKTNTYSNFNWEKTLCGVETLVGHNISFDLKYLYRYPEVREWIKEGKIWDTMLAEYLLSGQTKQFPSLDYTCVRYGGSLKDEKIKEYWEAGLSTEDIPKGELLEYLKHDLLNTRFTYLGQVIKAKQLGMYDVILVHMEALLALIEMEYNGLKFDLNYAREAIKKLKVEVEEKSSALKAFMQPCLTKVEVNPGSNDHLSLFLFGGTYRYKTKEPIKDEYGEFVYYKTGKQKGEIKERYVEKLEATTGLGIQPDHTWANAKQGFYQTNEDVVKTLKTRFEKGSVEHTALTLIDELRGLEKELGTYFEGYSKLVFTDGMIHHNLNTTVTATGRLSSSEPNMQNLSKNKGTIKKCFISRFGNAGVIAEGDFSQIEVVVQAFLSRDPRMMNDVRRGIDFHCMRLAFKLKEDYDEVVKKCKELPQYKLWRTHIKVFSFQRALTH
jgi:DNA polymerase I